MKVNYLIGTAGGGKTDLCVMMATGFIAADKKVVMVVRDGKRREQIMWAIPSLQPVPLSTSKLTFLMPGTSMDALDPNEVRALERHKIACIIVDDVAENWHFLRRLSHEETTIVIVKSTT